MAIRLRPRLDRAIGGSRQRPDAGAIFHAQHFRTAWHARYWIQRSRQEIRSFGEPVSEAAGRIAQAGSARASGSSEGLQWRWRALFDSRRLRPVHADDSQPRAGKRKRSNSPTEDRGYDGVQPNWRLERWKTEELPAGEIQRRGFPSGIHGQVRFRIPD